TIGAFIWVFLRQPQRFTRWRNVLAFTTAFAIVGFSLFPLMPPRLLNDGGPYGGRELSQAAIAEGRLDPGDVDFVDTLAVHGGLWSFDSGAMKEISNQYAAMPSLHTAWAVWSALVMWPLVRRRWAKALLVAYPLLTVYCIVVTANHFWLDGVGGLVGLTAGYLAGSALDDWNNRRLARRRATLA
ncbi:MAG TPA: phosphatase PAP2 family protein, partial [Acidimicrobiales bacterium]